MPVGGRCRSPRWRGDVTFGVAMIRPVHVALRYTPTAPRYRRGVCVFLYESTARTIRGVVRLLPCSVTRLKKEHCFLRNPGTICGVVRLHGSSLTRENKQKHLRGCSLCSECFRPSVLRFQFLGAKFCFGSSRLIPSSVWIKQTSYVFFKCTFRAEFRRNGDGHFRCATELKCRGCGSSS